MNHLPPEFPMTHPETEVWYRPQDFYDASVAQALVLEQMGYPITIAMIPTTHPELQAPSGIISPIDSKNAHRYDAFFKITYDWMLVNHLDELEIPGYNIPPDYSNFDQINRHPVKLVGLISGGEVVEIADYLKPDLEEHERLWHPDNNYPFKEIIERAFITAFDRCLQLADFHANDGYHKSEAQVLIRDYSQIYDALYQKGRRPLTPEDILGIVTNYYRYVEENSPIFAAYRDKKLPSSE